MTTENNKLTEQKHYFSMTLGDMFDIPCSICKEKELWVEHNDIREITGIGFIKIFECSNCGNLQFFKSKYDPNPEEFIK